MEDEAIARLRRAIDQADTDNLLDRLSWLTAALTLVRRELASTETAALAEHSVSAVARARGVSHQYMSRRARGAAA